MVDVALGRSIVLVSEWRAFPGGPLVDLDTNPSISIIPTAGPPAVLGPTTVDVVHLATGVYTYAWVASAPIGSYLVLWEGESTGDPVSATESLNVTASSATGAPCDWDVDPVALGVCSTWDDYSAAIQAAALEMSALFLWAATGRQYGVCSLTIRPSQTERGEVAYQTYEVRPGMDGLGVPGGPYLFGGRWFNAGCSSACCGNNACAIVLRGPVVSVDEVSIGEDVIPASAYRVDVTSGVYLLVRRDGECWPTCQNFTADEGETGSFTVTYDIGRALPLSLSVAAAILACEYAKSLTGGACKLPAKMTRLSRQGVEVELEPANPTEGTTGIREVDAVISALNPSRRQRPPVLLSPDLPENCDRVTVWTGGS
jgi:hypothetical protein